MGSSNENFNKKKIVFIMGATGTGKSRLSIDIATYLGSEIINSDKMQVYKSLCIVSNKVPECERQGVPHHLLGIIEDPNSDFTASDFRDHALRAIDSISKSGRVPVVAGGSNSYIEALVEDVETKFRSRFECCFIWLYVSPPTLHSYVSTRFDQMVKEGLVEEVRELFVPEADYSRGVRRSIGVPELDTYFKAEKENVSTDKLKMLLHQAIEESKVNTYKLIADQVTKIRRLSSDRGWIIHQIDATRVFEKSCKKEADETWDEFVKKPCFEIVSKFISKSYENGEAKSAILGSQTLGEKQFCHSDQYINMGFSNENFNKKKIVFIMGATGTGKSRLSIDIATYLGSEIINSDKMQVYKSLSIVSNKVPECERKGVPHHLLGIIEDLNSDFTASDFRDHALMAIDSISKSGRVPVIAGGSNSYIEALVEDVETKFRSRFECCFIWLDVSPPTLHSYVSTRFDQMVKEGLVEEVRELFVPEADYSRGVRRSIGVPELDSYFKAEMKNISADKLKMLLHEAVEESKLNTNKLIEDQVTKINRLRTDCGWMIHRIDATRVFEKNCKKELDDTWDEFVKKPSFEIVSNFIGKSYEIGEAKSAFSGSQTLGEAKSVISGCRTLGEAKSAISGCRTLGEVQVVN